MNQCPELLVVIEDYAETHNLIASEAELSALFDAEIMPGIIEVHGKVGEEFKDGIRATVSFREWTDTLVRDGFLYGEQARVYTYVGKWAWHNFPGFSRH